MKICFVFVALALLAAFSAAQAACGNLVCEPAAGEDGGNCPRDCAEEAQNGFPQVFSGEETTPSSGSVPPQAFPLNALFGIIIVVMLVLAGYGLTSSKPRVA